MVEEILSFRNDLYHELQQNGGASDVEADENTDKEAVKVRLGKKFKDASLAFHLRFENTLLLDFNISGSNPFIINSK